ncbi:MAG: zinc ribbon domain-containing protein [Kiritimatiellaeota bacterium]|nr:zinc ribbon domain-containing protein [Kiritimatiellota bacterium]
MPIYEYQCEKCRRVLNFLVRNTASHKPPACPKCGHPKMSRAISRFAAPKKGGKKADAEPAAGGPPPTGMPPGGGGDDMPPGMERLLSEAEGMDENDPRAMGRFMRKMAEQTGEPIPAEMDEVVRRLEAGEDPEKIEEKMGDVLGDEAGGGMGGPGGGADNTLYDA